MSTESVPVSDDHMHLYIALTDKLIPEERGVMICLMHGRCLLRQLLCGGHRTTGE